MSLASPMSVQLWASLPPISDTTQAYAHPFSNRAQFPPDLALPFVCPSPTLACSRCFFLFFSVPQKSFHHIPALRANTHISYVPRRFCVSHTIEYCCFETHALCSTRLDSQFLLSKRQDLESISPIYMRIRGG